MTDKFINFKVTRIVPESDIISSYYLLPLKPLLRDFIPGEYLIFEHLFENGEKVRREYSISGQDNDTIRITVKHETALSESVPDGLMSTHLHKNVKVGETLRAAGPMGKFTLNRSSTRPVVLLSGGVGLTPLVAMAHELAAKTKRKTLFIHACENGRLHAMNNEMRRLAKTHSNFTTHFVYNKPEKNDIADEDYDSIGFVDRNLLEKLSLQTECDFYLCGPSPFMQAMYDLLHEIGVRTEQISYEFFGPASVLKPKDLVITQPAYAASSTEQFKISFTKSGVDAHWDPKVENLLEFAEDNGVMVDFSCRAGTCDTCKSKVLSGQISYPQEPFERPADGYALLCCCIPESNLELDV